MPSVLEYVQDTAALQELRRTVKAWEHKADLAEVLSHCVAVVATVMVVADGAKADAGQVVVPVS